MNNEVFIIWGSPSSGKTTYVKEHKEADDIVIDLDIINAALSMTKGKERNEVVVPYSLAVRDYIFELIEYRAFTFERAWVIGCLPRMIDREYLVAKLNGELIHIDTDEKECVARAIDDIERIDKDMQVKVIKKYFDQLEI